MEEKIIRESKSYIETLFKQNDILKSGAITKEAMRDIVNTIVLNFSEHDALNELIEQHVKVQKYTEYNENTKKMEFKYQKDAISFSSALTIIVKFLKKSERRSSNAFSGKGLIRFTDLPSSDVLQVKREAKKEHK